MDFEQSAESCVQAMDRFFGPRVDLNCRSFDFTLEFEDIVMTCLPAACFLFLLPSEVFLHLRKSLKYSLRSKGFIGQLAVSALRLFKSQLGKTTHM